MVVVAALFVGACGKPPPDIALSPEAAQLIAQLRATGFPARYRFSYEPITIGIAGCFAANPAFDGSVDTPASEMELIVRGEPNRRAIVGGSQVYLSRSLAPEIPAATEWLGLGSLAASDSGRLQQLIGPGLTSYLVPPRMPTDPNRTLLSLIDVAAAVDYVGIEDVDGRQRRHLRVVTDPSRLAAQLGQQGPVPARQPIADAWIDDGGRVIRLEIGQASSARPGELDRQAAGYRTTYVSLDEPVAIATPAPEIVTAARIPTGTVPPGTTPDSACVVSVGN